MDAKNVMLHFMAKSQMWEDEHAMALATFYINLNCHQRKDQKNGKLTLLLYQSHVHWEWFDALKHNEGFNITLIEDDLLRNMAEEVGNAIQDRENALRDRDVDQVLCPKLKKPHTQLTVFTFSLPCLRSLLIYSIYSTCMCHPLRHLLPIAICHSLFAICHLPFAICHLPFAICHPPSAPCHAQVMTPPPVDPLAITRLMCNASATSPKPVMDTLAPMVL